MKIFVKYTLCSLILLAVLHSSAQSLTVSVGGVPKYSGIITNRADVEGLKEINQFLNTLESQLAAEFVKHGDVDYLDRTNTMEIFREKHLSSGEEFDASSGALRGLMGRLDYLAVLDASDPDSARIRLIDVETGAVRVIESCKKRTSFFGISSDTPPDCIPQFVQKAHAVTSAKLVVKQARLQKQQQAEKTAQQQEQAQDKQELKDQRAAQQKAAEQTAERAKEQAAGEAKQAAAQAEQAAEQAKLRSEIADVKPQLDDANARLSTSNEYWQEIERQLQADGHSLRPEIRSLLISTNSDGSRCRQSLAEMSVDKLHTCIQDLKHHLDTLDSYK